MTRRFALVGDPVAHSASPRMHAAAYEALSLDCAYEAIRATRTDLPGIVRRMRAGELAGVNVTVPHKVAILELVDGLDASARSAGAANTLVRGPTGAIVAYNTDVMAIVDEMAALSRIGPAFDGRGSAAVVLGTGGAASAAVAALVRLGVGAIAVRGRAFDGGARHDATITRLLALARSGSGGPSMSFEPWRPAEATDARSHIFVQATSLGMLGGGPGTLAAHAVCWPAVPKGAVALDVVYGEADTPFVRAARAVGAVALDGRGMLARQGARAFELWFGREAPFDAMRRAL